MIQESEVFRIGKLIKPHGIKGEISFAFDNDVFDRVNCPYLICLIDGIYVPFFIKEYRFKGKYTALIKFEDINSEISARRLNNTEVFFPRKYFEESQEEDIEYSWNYFIGFKLKDINLKKEIGIIDSVDESTLNTLFIVKDQENVILIPASEDFILHVDDKNKILEMNLPEGLLE